MSDKQFGMLIDLSLCIGCNACAVACKMENDVALGSFNTWVESWDAERADGYTCRVNMPKQCNHCSNPTCLEVCPTGATYMCEEDGTVQIDLEKCIGCQLCVSACPYGARWVDEENTKVRKCTFCHHRTPYGLLPACVATCVSQARLFGDVNDPDSDIAKRIAEAKSLGTLLPDEGLNPNVYYIGLDEALAAPKRSAVHKGGNVVEPYGGAE